jgi:hypothetical protein
LLKVQNKGAKKKIVVSASKLYFKSITANGGLGRLTFYQKLVSLKKIKLTAYVGMLAEV